MRECMDSFGEMVVTRVTKFVVAGKLLDLPIEFTAW